MYSIVFRPELNLLDIRWSGLFDQPSINTYADELIRRFREQGFVPGYRLRMDMSGTSVQPVDAAQAINRRLGTFHRASRIAIVTASAITRLQVRRFMHQPYLRIFACADAALDWLVAPDAATLAA